MSRSTRRPSPLSWHGKALDRRQLLRLGVGGAAGLALGGLGSSACLRTEGPNAADTAKLAGAVPEPDWSAAFLTDPHVFAEKGAADGLAKAVDHLLSQPHKAELVVTGGDLAFDIMETDRAAADAQYDLFDSAIAGLKLEIHHTIGNHDCFGVSEQGVVVESDPLFGKKYFLERFGRAQPYTSFDHENWHFVILDTIGIEGRSYYGHVDQEQLDWLADDLAAAARPTVVIGHIPLFSNYIESVRGTAEGIPAGLAVVNAHEVLKVLLAHPVKLVLAGHLHVNEIFRYKGIEFANVGAISGNWWQGERDGFQEGYALLDFRGSEVQWRYVDYGWEVPLEAAV
jgi:3',5'-cyclic AMP phosphodiesterase CpdA